MNDLNPLFDLPVIPRLTRVEAFMVRRFHPRRLLLDAAALPWVVYYVWQHNWVLALVIALVSGSLGLLATADVNPYLYSRTFMGRVALLHLHPLNMIAQGIGLAGMLVALWTHSVPGILGAVSVLFLGHMVGWDEVIAAPTARKIRDAA